MAGFKALRQQVGECTICEKYLPLGPRPVCQFHPDARLVIIGQAPGTKVHASGVPWQDPSGDRLREWLGIDSDTFYSNRVALLPMGFCYPGRGKSGDLPPRPECAATWHEPIMKIMKKLEFLVLTGHYAQKHYLEKPGPSLTQTVKDFKKFLPRFMPLPHPSPRNNIWLAKNPWFAKKALPALRRRVTEIL